MFAARDESPGRLEDELDLLLSVVSDGERFEVGLLMEMCSDTSITVRGDRGGNRESPSVVSTASPVDVFKL